MMVLRDAEVLAEIFVRLSPAYVMRLIVAPIVARWLFTVLMAESMVAIAADALAAVEIPAAAVVRPRVESAMEPIATSMVCPDV